MHMGPIVVDVGNTRIKWGLCSSAQVWSVAPLPPDDAEAWQRQWNEWKIQPEQEWVVSGVHPERRDTLVAWVKQHGAPVRVLASAKQVPLTIDVEQPDKVGIDRLLNAVAANRRRHENVAAIIVDAGSAVTVDYVDSLGVFRGGAIFPGFRLMASALHDYTALLPIVEITEEVTSPARSTAAAMQTGVLHAVVGGIERLISEYQHRYPAAFEVFITGGDAKMLAGRMHHPPHVWPEMTLEGVLHSHRHSPLAAK
ncbi:MAG: type III pantothenate kinase [Planctomycetes bacterium]|nr:type III pantothenate kinase [Planctomycetota bacterium]